MALVENLKSYGAIASLVKGRLVVEGYRLSIYGKGLQIEASQATQAVESFEAVTTDPVDHQDRLRILNPTFEVSLDNARIKGPTGEIVIGSSQLPVIIHHIDQTV